MLKQYFFCLPVFLVVVVLSAGSMYQYFVKIVPTIYRKLNGEVGTKLHLVQFYFQNIVINVARAMVIIIANFLLTLRIGPQQSSFLPLLIALVSSSSCFQ